MSETSHLLARLAEAGERDSHCAIERRALLAMIRHALCLVDGASREGDWFHVPAYLVVELEAAISTYLNALGVAP